MEKVEISTMQERLFNCNVICEVSVNPHYASIILEILTQCFQVS